MAPLNDLKKSERVTAAAKPEQHCHEGQMAWAPDSKALAFFSDCAKPGEQSDLYLSRLDGQPARRLTELKGYVEAPAFSPDGKSVAFLYVEGATRPAGALAAMKPPSGVIGEDGVEIQRVAVVRVDAQRKRRHADRCWRRRPICMFMSSTGRRTRRGWPMWPPIRRERTTGGLRSCIRRRWTATPKAILAPAEVAGALHGLQIAVPRWSPDGKAIAFIGGLMSDQGVDGRRCVDCLSEGGEPRDLTPQRPTTPAWIEWDDDEPSICERAGRRQLPTGAHEAAGRQDQRERGHQLWQPDLQHSGQRGRRADGVEPFCHGRPLAFRVPGQHLRPSAGDLSRPEPDASAGSRSADWAAFGQLSHFNDGVEAGVGQVGFAELEERRVPGAGLADAARGLRSGEEVSADCGGARRPGLGGGAALGRGRRAERGGLLRAGLLCAAAQSARQLWAGRGVYRRPTAKISATAICATFWPAWMRWRRKYPVDPNRVGLTGWSYGGFMTMFAVTQTQRFKAAVAGAGISDWLSYYGENSIDQWMIPYFGASVYDDPAVYAKSSAINFIKQAQTPTLVVVGDRDGECPAPQSFEFWHALRDLHVPTQLVVYPNEGHGFVDPAHRRDVMERAVEWFERYMPPDE